MYTDWFLTHGVGSDPRFCLGEGREASGIHYSSVDDNGTVTHGVTIQHIPEGGRPFSHYSVCACIHLPHSKYSGAPCERHCSANNVLSVIVWNISPQADMREGTHRPWFHLRGGYSSMSMHCPSGKSGCMFTRTIVFLWCLDFYILPHCLSHFSLSVLIWIWPI